MCNVYIKIRDDTQQQEIELIKTLYDKDLSID